MYAIMEGKAVSINQEVLKQAGSPPWKDETPQTESFLVTINYAIETQDVQMKTDVIAQIQNILKQHAPKVELD